MKDKIFEWLGRNRRPIGYTVGGLNLLVALNHLIQGEIGLAVLWLFIGVMIVIDVGAYK
jgi:hypothetical protein